MKAKKLGALLLTASLAAGMLAGCGDKDDAKNSANTNADAGTGTDDVIQCRHEPALNQDHSLLRGVCLSDVSA